MAAARPASVRVGSFLGIPIYAELSLFVTGALVTFAFLPQLEDIDPGIGNGAYLLAVGFAVLLYLSILVHELAHAAVGKAFGLPVRSVALSMLGGVTDLGRSPQSAWRSFAISAAGPGATLAIAAAGYGLLQTAPDGGLAHLVLAQLTISNVIVGIYNLLPGLPLDGGSMLSAVVWRITGDELRATVFAAWAGRVVALLTAALPFIAGYVTQQQPSTLLIVWAAILAVVLWTGSTQALASARVRSRLPLLALRSLVRPDERVVGDRALVGVEVPPRLEGDRVHAALGIGELDSVADTQGATAHGGQALTPVTPVLSHPRCHTCARTRCTSEVASTPET